jgi:hypothetical protein
MHAMTAGRPSVRVLTPTASAEEAAAIVAVIEQFARATAGPRTELAAPEGRWRRTALLEGIAREPWDDLPDPWINT